MSKELDEKVISNVIQNGSASKIQITVTTFCEDEDGVLDEKTVTTSAVKIDGEDDSSNVSSSPQAQIIRNLLVLSFGQFLLFMAFDTMSNLQSTINGDAGVGVVSLAVIYGFLTFSSLFLPTLIIRSLGCKKTLVFSVISFCPYILANYYPAWSTLIPTAVVCGLVSGPMWSARSTYLNEISHRYAAMRGTSAEVMNAWFFSIATTIQQNTEIWGNLISYFVLMEEDDHEPLLSTAILDHCGPDFCDDIGFSSNPNLSPPANEKRYILVTIFTSLSLMAAFFMVFFLDPLESEESKQDETHHNFRPMDIFATFKQMVKVDQLLLLPLSFYTGLVDGFYNGDYSKAYVACAWGVPHVGVVSICYGVVTAIVDSASAPTVAVLGRVGVFLVAALAHFSLFISLTLWKPSPEHTTTFFLVAGVHGIGNGIWMSQLVAFYGYIFKKNEEAAFSCFYFWNSLGFLVAYSYSSYFCTYVKLFIPVVMLGIGLLCYLVVEIRIVKKALAAYNTGRLQ